MSEKERYKREDDYRRGGSRDRIRQNSRESGHRYGGDRDRREYRDSSRYKESRHKDYERDESYHERKSSQNRSRSPYRRSREYYQGNDSGRKRFEDRRPKYDDRRPPNRNYKSGGGRNTNEALKFDKYSARNLSPFRSEVLSLSERQRVLQSWDVAPPGFERINADLAKLTGLFPPPGNIAKITNFVPPTLDPSKAAMLAMLSEGSDGNMGKVKKNHLSSGAAMFANALRKQAKRIYLGNLPKSTNEAEITEWLSLGLQDKDVVLSVDIPGEGLYGFVDLKSAEDATRALELDGNILSGVPISVRRTREYENATNIAKNQVDIGVGSDAAPEDKQIVIYNIPSFLAEDHLKHLLKPFGYLKFIKVINLPLTQSGADAESSLAVLEWDDPKLIDPFKKALKEFRFSPEYDPIKVIGLPDCLDINHLAKVLADHGMTPGKATSDPSPILQLLNIDTSIPSIIEAIEEECKLYGRVKRVIIPSTQTSDAHNVIEAENRVAGEVKVFVEFENVDGAISASESIGGRSLAGRCVLTSFFPLEKYRKGIF